MAAGTIGTRSCGSGPTGQPAPASYAAAATPSAADSPNALPPASTTASTAETRLRGSSRSVSRVPGPPPRTSTPPTVPGGGTTTVTPVSQPGSSRVVWPTRTPATSVMASWGPGCTAPA